MEPTAQAYRVAIYARVSTPNQRERDLSVPEQLGALRHFCEERGWPVVAEFVDEGISGGKTVARKQFMRMVNAGLGERTPFDLILTRDAARFGRGDEDNAIRAKLRRNGVKIDNMESPVGDMHGDMTPSQRLNERIRSAMDISQREEVPARVIASQKRAVTERGITGSIGTVYGYRQVYVGSGPRAKRTVEIDPATAPVVREMFERVAKGESVRSVRNWLNKMHLPTPRKSDVWNDSTVKRILKNETVTGTAIYGRLQTTTNPKTEKARYVKSKKDPVRLEGAFPALVSRELFGTVQGRLANAVRTKPGEGNPENIVRGLLYCAQCGWKLAFQKRRSHWYYLCSYKKMFGASADPRCSNTLRKEYVDKAVIDYISSLVQVSYYAKPLIEAIRKYNSAAESYQGVDEAALIADRIRDLERKQKNYADAIGENGPMASLIDNLRATEQAIEEARSQRDKLTASLATIERIDEKKTLDAAKGLRVALRQNDEASIKELLPAILDHIEVDLTIRPSDRKLPANIKTLYLNRDLGPSPLTFMVRYDIDRLKRISNAALRSAFPDHASGSTV